MPNYVGFCPECQDRHAASHQRGVCGIADRILLDGAAGNVLVRGLNSPLRPDFICVPADECLELLGGDGRLLAVLRCL
jgi:hypothetical protein